MRAHAQHRDRALRSILLLAVGAVGAALLASQAAQSHCRPSLAGPHADLRGSSSDVDRAAATSALLAAADLQPDPQHKQPPPQLGRHPRPPELDAPANSAILGLEAARAASAADALAPVPQPGVIPRILHRVYIVDPNDTTRSNFTLPMAHQQWIETCQLHHHPRAGWQYMLWDYTAARTLMVNHFPWFLPFYDANLTKAIEKSDVVRYAVLHRLGGVYLDSDIECWREAYDMLEGFDFVGQGAHSTESVTNAAIAARPGLEVFTKALRFVQQRDVNTKNQMIKVIARTGPQLLTDVLVAMGLELKKGLFDPQYDLNGVVYRIWPAGSWYQPCLVHEPECRRRIYQERLEGRYDMRRLAGFHRNAGSWIRGWKGFSNATHELCGSDAHVGSRGQIGG